MSELIGFEVKDSEEFGRCVIAKMDFRIRDLIFDEEPLLLSPITKPPISYSCQKLPKEIDLSTLVCVGCFKLLTAENVKFCGKCKWPICCKKCGRESLHARYECSLFQEKKICVSAKVYAHLSILRCVLMYRDHDTTHWDYFSSLSSASSINYKYFSRLEQNYKVRHFLRSCFHMDVDEKVIGQIIGACNLNGFEVGGEDEYGNWYRGQAVYHISSMFSHCCAPNATWKILPYDYNGIKKWHIRIYAQRNILSNETISISYIPDCFSLETAERMQHIRKNYLFVCKCSRCSDPSEFSFYTEAVICQNCYDDTSDEFSVWTCTFCGHSEPSTYATTCVENFEPSSIWKYLTRTKAMSLPSPNERLSWNHREIIITLYYWLQDRSHQQFPELQLQCDNFFVQYMQTATKCIKVFRMFGTMTNIVEMEWFFARIIAAYFFKTIDFQSMPWYDEYMPEEKLTIITAICAHLNTAYETMQWCTYNYFVLDLRRGLIHGHKFWNNELNILKAMTSVDSSDSTDEVNIGGTKVINKVTELKSSLNELSDPPMKEESTSQMLTEGPGVDELAVSKSLDLSSCDVPTSSRYSKSTPGRPAVALLTKWDFYFNA